jgi:hypothetical protein
MNQNWHTHNTQWPTLVLGAKSPVFSFQYFMARHDYNGLTNSNKLQQTNKHQKLCTWLCCTLLVCDSVSTKIACLSTARLLHFTSPAWWAHVHDCSSVHNFVYACMRVCVVLPKKTVLEEQLTLSCLTCMVSRTIFYLCSRNDFLLFRFRRTSARSAPEFFYKSFLESPYKKGLTNSEPSFESER